MGAAESLSRVLGRYAISSPLASGGMATVHLGSMLGAAGFSRTVAIKRLHPHLAHEAEFVTLLFDEAHLAGRIRHPNVVQTLDIVAADGELFLVMEYVHGESLSRVARELGGAPIPCSIAAAIASGVLHGLHAAHEATGERGEPLEIVHRDVSPQNVMICTDGVARVLDFGVAKATTRLQSTRDGQVKGKLAYMAPEQVRGREITRAVDIYATSVVLWEMLTGRRLFEADNDAHIIEQVLLGIIEPPSAINRAVTPELDALVLRGLACKPSDRFETAREMALAVERAVVPALPSEVGAWVERTARTALLERAEKVAQMEASNRSGPTTGALLLSQVRSTRTSSAPSPDVSSAVRSSVEKAPPHMSSRHSASAPDERPALRRRRSALAAAVVALVLLGAVAFDRATPPVGTSARTSALGQPRVEPPSAPTFEVVEAPPDANPPLTHAPTAHSAAGVSSLVGKASPEAARARLRGSSKRGAQEHPGPDCATKYTVDPAGVRIFKRECL